MTEQIAKAFSIANRIHSDQKRPNGVTAYVVHPMAVAALVFRYGGNEAQAIAALLHDTIGHGSSKYPEIRYESLKSEFSKEVADFVYGFEDPPPPSSGYATIKEEKLAYLDKIKESDSAQALIFACEELDELQDALRNRKFSRNVISSEEVTRQMNQAWYFKECLSVVLHHTSRKDLNTPLGHMLCAEFASTLKEFQGLVFEGRY